MEYTDDLTIIQRDSYPQTLQEMKSPPEKLFLRGRFPALQDQKYLCVVGSRKASIYGEECTRQLLLGLRDYPITIVSGLAYGIDSFAHEAALACGLHTVAFPGSSLDYDEIYPPEHRPLARRIVAEGGALLSEWEPGYHTEKWAFPARNRLMAGLCHATLIIEAGKGSGSLMTAKYAELFDRDVFAVPGHIASPQSYGTHMLIQRGAALISSSRDILYELGYRLPKKERRATFIELPMIPIGIRSDTTSMRILEMLAREDMLIDDLVHKTHVVVQELNLKLSLLEISGLIRIDGSLVRLVKETRRERSLV